MRLGLLVALAASTVQAGPRPDDGVIVIRGASIVDVERGALVAGKNVVVRGSRIDSIVNAGQAPPEGARVVEATGMFLMPGLFDAHTHIFASPDTFGPLLVAHGVTAARDLGAPTDLVIALRDSYAKGEELGPDLVVTGAIIDGDPPVWPFSEAVTTPEEGRAAVRKLKDAGVDMIKVYTRLKKDVYEAVVSEAHALGLKATGHIPESVTLTEAMAAGHDCNEHLMRIDVAIAALAGQEQERDRALTRMMSGWAHFDKVSEEQLIELGKAIAKSGMVQCPTLIVQAGIGRAADPDALKDPQMEYVPSYFSQMWASPAYTSWAKQAAQIVPLMQKTVAAMHKGGATLMVGTDLANPFVFAGKAVHEEMALWQDAGIPAPDILRSATIIPATFCGVSDAIGTIAPGKSASMVILRKNPLENVRNATEIEHVFLRGDHMDRAALDGIFKSVREKASGTRAADEEAAVAEIKVALPGEVVAKGKYTFKFGQYPAGSEEFTLTKAADGYHFFADVRPEGGGQLPSTLRLHADETGRVTKAVWNRRGAAPMVATYTIAGNEVKIEATSSGKPEQPETRTLGEKDALSYSPSAASFFALRERPLKVGETQELNALSFGFPDWRLQGSAYKITRLEDSTIERAGEQVKCQHYKAELKTQIGVFNTEMWTDADYIPYRVVMRMPFGVVTAERD